LLLDLNNRQEHLDDPDDEDDDDDANWDDEEIRKSFRQKKRYNV